MSTGRLRRRTRRACHHSPAGVRAARNGSASTDETAELHEFTDIIARGAAATGLTDSGFATAASCQSGHAAEAGRTIPSLARKITAGGHHGSWRTPASRAGCHRLRYKDARRLLRWRTVARMSGQHGRRSFARETSNAREPIQRPAASDGINDHYSGVPGFANALIRTPRLALLCHVSQLQLGRSMAPDNPRGDPSVQLGTSSLALVASWLSLVSRRPQGAPLPAMTVVQCQWDRRPSNDDWSRFRPQSRRATSLEFDCALLTDRASPRCGLTDRRARHRYPQLNHILS